MTGNTRPPRFAVWLLDRFGAENEPLAGDLVEAYATRGSRWWFWRQVLAAVFLRPRVPREIRPLQLVDREPLPAPPTGERREINLTGGPIHGVGGLSLVVWVLLVTLVAPHLWWIALAAALQGCLLGLAFIALRRPRGRETAGVLLQRPIPRS